MNRGRRRFGVVTLAMIMAMVLGMMLPALAAAEIPPQLTIKSTNGTNTVTQGGDVIIIGEGFFSNEPVDIVITTPEGRVFFVARAQTNRAGEFQILVDFGTAPVGTYNVLAVGVVSTLRATGQIFLRGGRTPGVQGLASIEATFVFRRLTAPGATEGTTSSQGRFLLVKGFDFFPQEIVSCFVTFPNGQVQFLFERLTTASEFAEEVFFGSAPVGRYAVTCVGQSSARSAIAFVDLTPGDVLLPIAQGTLEVDVTPNVVSRTNAAFPRAEQVLVVTAEGALAGERISFFFTQPNGAVDPADTVSVIANSAGEASIAVVFRSFELPGTWFVTAFGNTSLFRGVDSFVVNP